ncbi:MAG TPA: 50S ribosomal protein L6 [Polyangiaceae bacterium]|nr:50S ribosomal protein L6 [Polyangiaceae bacterium]
MASAAQVVKQSRVGKRPIPIPKGVTVNVSGKEVSVQGPKGKLSGQLPDRVQITKEGEALLLSSSAGGDDAPRLQGLGRALVANMVRGCAEGYERVLELVGTGYRCELKGKTVNFSLGLSHPASVELPASVSATIPGDSKGTLLILSSPDKALIGQLAATIKRLRPPEPYGGKGIRYRGEVIRRKAGKAGKGRSK